MVDWWRLDTPYSHCRRVAIYEYSEFTMKWNNNNDNNWVAGRRGWRRNKGRCARDCARRSVVDQGVNGPWRGVTTWPLTSVHSGTCYRLALECWPRCYTNTDTLCVTCRPIDTSIYHEDVFTWGEFGICIIPAIPLTEWVIPKVTGYLQGVHNITTAF